MKEKHIRNIKLTVNIEDFDSVLNGINVSLSVCLSLPVMTWFFFLFCVCVRVQIYSRKKKN